MKTFYNENREIITTFSSDEEKDIVFRLIKRHIEFMPKKYRKDYTNWCIVSDLTYHGSGFSFSICKALGVDPMGYEWVIKEDEVLENE